MLGWLTLELDFKYHENLPRINPKRTIENPTFLTQSQMTVVIESTSSEVTSVDSGVPQGTVLGPLLFLCHKNDLPQTVTSHVRMFTDDCLLYRQINGQNDHHTLQKDLKNLEEWANKWGMRFNAKQVLHPQHQKHLKSFLPTK